MSAPETEATAPEAALSPSDVRVVGGRLSDNELAAVAVVVSAMSVTSRLEAAERALAQGSAAEASAWTVPIHSHPRAHGLRAHPGPGAWQFSDR